MAGFLGQKEVLTREQSKRLDFQRVLGGKDPNFRKCRGRDQWVVYSQSCEN